MTNAKNMHFTPQKLCNMLNKLSLTLSVLGFAAKKKNLVRLEFTVQYAENS